MTTIEQELSAFGTVEKIEVDNNQIEVKITGFENQLNNYLAIGEILLRFHPTYSNIKMQNIDAGIFHIIHSQK